MIPQHLHKPPGVSRRELLRAGLAASVTLSALPLAQPATLWGAEAGQPRRGGILRVRGFDPPNFDHQLTTVDGGLVVPFDAFAQVENIRGVVQLFPAFGQIGLDNEGARLYLGANFMPHQLAVDEAERALCPDIDREVRIEVYRVPPAHA